MASFDTVFGWYLSMLGGFVSLHIVKSTSCNLIMQNIVFLVLHYGVHVPFSVIMYFPFSVNFKFAGDSRLEIAKTRHICC